MEAQNPGEERAARLVSFTGIISVVIAALLGSAGLLSLSGRWAVLAVVVHFVPALVQCWSPLRVVGRWLAVFLIVQALVSFAVLSTDVHTLPKNMKRQFMLEPGTVSGITGLQVVTTDHLGFRVTREVDYEKKGAETYRIFALGGSTTEQLLLDDRRTWTHLLQDILQSGWPAAQVEVINTGASGTRAVNHLATLRTLDAYQPDLVLILVGINDWNKHIREYYGSREYGAVAAAIWRIQFENTLLGRALAHALERVGATPGTTRVDNSGRRMVGQTNSLERIDRRSLSIERVAADYAQTLDEIASECVRMGARCLFLTQPHAYRPHASEELRRRFWMTPPFEDYTLDQPSLQRVASTYNQYLLEFANARGMGACDIAEKTSTRLDGFYDDCHFNELGAKVVAAGIAECLLASGRGPETASP